jgi:hypothetical protein
MSKPNKRQRATGRREERVSFAGIPRHVMLSDSFREIGPNAVRVLLWMAFQYRGGNNGYLSATRTEAKDWSIAGTDTLARAIADLKKHQMITLTRQGRFMKPGGSPNLYALTWLSVDSRTGDQIDIAPTRLPLRTDWRRTIKNNAPRPVLESVAPVSGQCKSKDIQ